MQNNSMRRFNSETASSAMMSGLGELCEFEDHSLDLASLQAVSVLHQYDYGRFASGAYLR